MPMLYSEASTHASTSACCRCPHRERSFPIALLYTVAAVLEATAGARPNHALDAWTRKTRSPATSLGNRPPRSWGHRAARSLGLSDPSAYFAGEPNRNVRNLAAWVSRQSLHQNNPLLRQIDVADQTVDGASIAIVCRIFAHKRRLQRTARCPFGNSTTG